MAKKQKDAFSTLTKRERKLLNLDNHEDRPFKSATHQLAESLTKGMDKKKLERDLKRLEQAEFEG